VAFTTQSGATGTDFTTLLGTALADSVAITDNQLDINALAGNDTITAAGARDKIKVSAGDGNDVLTFAGELIGADVSLDKGNDIANLQDISGTISGGDGADSILAVQTANTAKLTGSSGNDTITVTGKAEAQTTINGGADNAALQ
jgi:Ca2+-binding RTX toxin-like protein